MGRIKNQINMKKTMGAGDKKCLYGTDYDPLN